MRASLFVLVGLMLAGSLMCQADVFTVSGDFDGYYGTVGTLSGTETIDTVMGRITAVDIIATLDGSVFTFTTLDSGYASGPCVIGPCDVFGQDVSGPDVQGRLDFDITATQGLVGFKGGGFCGGAMADCQFSEGVDDDDYLEDGQFGGNVFFVTDGALTPAAVGPVGVTPEPSSFVLLGTGLVGLARAGWRRVRARR